MEENKEIVVCTGSYCMMRGNRKNIKLIEDYLDKHNLDIKIHLRGELCTVKCGAAPMIKFGNVQHTMVTEQKLYQLLKAYANNN